MGKLAETIAAEMREIGGQCALRLLRDSLPKDVKADLDAALASATPATTITRALVKLGYDIGKTSVQRHRRGECHCERSS